MSERVEEIAALLQASQRGVDPRRQGWKVEYLEAVGRAYEEDGNPTLPWEAWRWARHHSLPVPDWVLGYIDGSVERMRTELMSGRRGEAAAVGHAFGFLSTRGRELPAAARLRHQLHQQLAFEFVVAEAVAKEQEPGKPPKIEAYLADVQNRHPGVSATTIRRAVTDHRQAAERALTLVREIYLHE